MNTLDNHQGTCGPPDQCPAQGNLLHVVPPASPVCSSVAMYTVIASLYACAVECYVEKTLDQRERKKNQATYFHAHALNTLSIPKGVIINPLSSNRSWFQLQFLIIKIC